MGKRRPVDCASHIAMTPSQTTMRYTPRRAALCGESWPLVSVKPPTGWRVGEKELVGESQNGGPSYCPNWRGPPRSRVLVALRARTDTVLGVPPCVGQAGRRSRSSLHRRCATPHDAEHSSRGGRVGSVASGGADGLRAPRGGRGCRSLCRSLQAGLLWSHQGECVEARSVCDVSGKLHSAKPHPHRHFVHADQKSWALTAPSALGE